MCCLWKGCTRFTCTYMVCQPEPQGRISLLQKLYSFEKTTSGTPYTTVGCTVPLSSSLWKTEEPAEVIWWTFRCSSTLEIKLKLSPCSLQEGVFQYMLQHWTQVHLLAKWYQESYLQQVKPELYWNSNTLQNDSWKSFSEVFFMTVESLQQTSRT